MSKTFVLGYMPTRRVFFSQENYLKYKKKILVKIKRLVAWFIKTAQPVHFGNSSEDTSDALCWHNNFCKNKQEMFK